MNPTGTAHVNVVFDFKESCVCCLRCKDPDEYYINSDHKLEKWSKRKATPQSREMTATRLDTIIHRNLDGDEVERKAKMELVKARVAIDPRRGDKLDPPTLSTVARAVLEVNKEYKA